jgi:hypothetical protein
MVRKCERSLTFIGKEFAGLALPHDIAYQRIVGRLQLGLTTVYYIAILQYISIK